MKKEDAKLFIQDNCCICLDTLNKNEIKDKKYREIFLQCGHNFHEKCIKNWIKNKKICPICRQNIKECDEREITTDISFEISLEILQSLLRESSEIQNNTNCLDQCISLNCNSNNQCTGDLFKCCDLLEIFCSGGSSGSW